MKNPFETYVSEISNLIYIYLKNRNLPNESVSILDWSNNLIGTEGFNNYIWADPWADPEECTCKLPISCSSFDNEIDGAKTNYFNFSAITQNLLCSNQYNLIILREIGKYDSIFDVIKRSAACIKDNGLIYFNLVITEYLEAIIDTAIKNGLYPISITDIRITEYCRPEFNGYYDEDEFKRIYDFHGYIQMCFIKRQLSQFLFTKVTDKNIDLIDEKESIYPFKNAGIFKIDQSLAHSEYNEACTDEDKLIEFSEYIELENRDKFIRSLIGAPKFPETIKVAFSDYFIADMPHHTELSELDTDKYYYLSPNLIMHTMVDNIINDKCDKNSEYILNHISFNHLGNHYTIIDTDKNIISSNIFWTVQRNDYFERIGQSCWAEGPIQINALNNICNANIDIQATIIYNLIRIKPIRKISLLYLKKYFHTTEYIKAIENAHAKNIKGFDSHIFGQDKTDRGIGYISLCEFAEKYCDNPERQDKDYGGFSVEELNSSYIYIDDLKKHKEIIDNFQNNQDTSLEKYKNTVTQRFFDVAFFNNLKEKEDLAKKTYDDIESLSLLGTEKQLAIAEMNYDIIKQTESTEINMINFYTAIEKYLRLCVACYPRKDEIDTGNKSLNRIAAFTMGDLYYCFSNNMILFENISIQQRSDLLLDFEAIKKARNAEAHQGQGIKKEDAENWVNKIYEFLKFVSEAFNVM